MLVTLSGIVMLVKLSQEENAELPMLVILSPMVTLVKLVQLRNAEPPMLVTGKPLYIPTKRFLPVKLPMPVTV